MKKITAFIAPICLMLAILALMTSCTGGAVTLPEGTEAHQNKLVDFQKANNEVMTAVAEKILADNEYAYYSYYATTTVGDKKSDVVRHTFSENGEQTQTPCLDETLLALAKTDFYGDITCTGKNSVVSFRPNDQITGVSFFLVYCKDEADQKYLQKDFLINTRNVTVTPIEGNWYIIMGV